MLGKLWRVVISLIYLTGYISANIHFIRDVDDDSTAEYANFFCIYPNTIRYEEDRGGRRCVLQINNCQRLQNRNAELELLDKIHLAVSRLRSHTT